MKHGFMILMVLLFLFVHPPQYKGSVLTVDNALSIHPSYANKMALDSLGNLHIFWKKCEPKNDPSKTGNVFEASKTYLQYSKYDKEGNHILTTKVCEGKLPEMLIASSINIYGPENVIVLWEDMGFGKLAILNGNGEIISEIFPTVSLATRITHDKDENIFIIREPINYPGSMQIFQITLEKISNGVLTKIRVFRAIENGGVIHSILPKDFSVITLGNGDIIIAMRIETYIKNTREKLYTAKDRFAILRLNTNGEMVSEPEIISCPLAACNVYRKAWIPNCEFVKLENDSILLNIGSKDLDDVVYQIKFSQEGRIIPCEKAVKKEVAALNSFENLDNIGIQSHLKWDEGNRIIEQRHIYGIDSNGNIQYVKRERIRE